MIKYFIFISLVLCGFALGQSNQQITFSNLINQLPVGAVPLTGTEPMVIVQGGVAHQVPSNAIGALINTAPPIRVAMRIALSASDNVSSTSDYFICPLNSSGAATETLPASPTTGWTFLIKDCNGNAGSNNITIAGNGRNIDGASTFVMSTAYQAIAVTYNGSQWSVN